MKKSVFLVVILFLFFSVSCQKKMETKPDVKTKKETISQEQNEKKAIDNTVINENSLKNIDKDKDLETKTIDELNKENILEDVYFEFDKATLTPETREVLKKHAKWLKEHPTVKILIEGHCDERGTEQYNLALGDRRAHAVKNYLISLGISPERMKTISFGEMFPKVKGHNEWAWSQNRRCHFVIISK